MQVKRETVLSYVELSELSFRSGKPVSCFEFMKDLDRHAIQNELDRLAGEGLIEFNKDPQFYYLTVSGRDLLKKLSFNMMMNF